MDLLEACRATPRTLVVLDWPNLKWSAHNDEYRIDINDLFDFLHEATVNNALICAFTRINNTEKPHSDETIDSWVLERAGFSVITTERPRGKDADVDAALSILVTWHIARNEMLSNLVIVSGDGDYTPLITLAKHENKMRGKPLKVSVLAFQSSLSTELKRAADHTYAMEKVPGLIKKHKRKDTKRHGQ